MVVAYITDLFFGTRIEATGRASGVGVKLVRTEDAFRAALAESAPRLVLIDLNAPGINVSRIAELAAGCPRRVGFVRHTSVELIEAGTAAGLEVLARSQFTEALPALLAGAQAKSPPQ